MPLKTELKKIVDDHSVTGLIQAFIAGHHAQYGLMTDYKCQSLNSPQPILMSIPFKESTVILSPSGNYADLLTVLSLLNEVVTEREIGVLP